MAKKSLGVIFDLDGVMFDTERLTMQKVSAASKQLGLSMADTDYHRLLGRRWSEALLVMSEILGSEVQARALMQATDQLLLEYLESGSFSTKEGLPDLINYLDTASIPKAVASSSDHNWVHGHLASLSASFDTVITAKDVVNGKPHPEPFLRAAQGMGREPKDCIVIEDSAVGIQAARAGGFVAILVRDMAPPSEETLKSAHYSVESLTEVRQIIENL